MMMTSAPSSSFHDYLTMDEVWSKTDSLSPDDTHDEHFEQSFEEEININTNNNQTMNNNRIPNVKRPMNAFLLWARGERKRVSSDGYGVSQTSLSKLLGETWRHMSLEEKQPFLDMAETLKKQHHIDHPDYRFKPRQRSATGNKAIAKKYNVSPMLRQQHTPMTDSSSSSSSTKLTTQNMRTSPISNATPHPIQSSVLTMCQSIVSSTSDHHSDWFSKLTQNPQSVIVAPTLRSHISPSSSSSSSRRAVRIQIINKHDDIALPNSASVLPMTPSPATVSSQTSLPMIVGDSASTFNEYLNISQNMFQNFDSQQSLATAMAHSIGYEEFNDSPTNHFTDLEQHCDLNGWIDTPLSNLGTNSSDMIPSPYASYDFLSL